MTCLWTNRVHRLDQGLKTYIHYIYIYILCPVYKAFRLKVRSRHSMKPSRCERIDIKKIADCFLPQESKVFLPWHGPLNLFAILFSGEPLPCEAEMFGLTTSTLNLPCRETSTIPRSQVFCLPSTPKCQMYIPVPKNLVPGVGWGGFTSFPKLHQ